TAQLLGGAPLVARRGDDVAMLPSGRLPWAYGGFTGDGSGWLRWYVFDGRGLFRPDEDVPVKGWLRPVMSRDGGVLGEWDRSVETVEYTLLDGKGTEVASGHAPVDAAGG